MFNRRELGGMAAGGLGARAVDPAMMRDAASPAPPVGAGSVSLLSAASDDPRSDSTDAIQRLINANKSFSVLNGEGRTYRITRPLTIPGGSRMLSLFNLQLKVDGDHAAIQHADDADLISFFELEKCLIDVTGHRTRGRPAVNFSRMSNFAFRKVWVTGAPGVTTAFYGRGANGSTPYYGVFDSLYVGNVGVCIRFEDAGGPIDACNSITVRDSRFQPGSGNVGVFIGRNCQNIRVLDTTFESFGGVGVSVGGVACLISGNRFESMDVGVAYQAGAYSNVEMANYYDSNKVNRSGFERAAGNSVLHELTGAGGQRSRLSGSLNLEEALEIGEVQVVGHRRGGWELPSGPASRDAFETSTVTTAQLAARLKALIADLHGHGLIGS